MAVRKNPFTGEFQLTDGTVVPAAPPAGAPASAEYLLLAPHPGAPNARVFTPGTGLVGVDGGAGGSYLLSLSDTGVIAASYGSATSVPVFQVDAQGRLVSVMDVPIAFPPDAGGTVTSVDLTAPAEFTVGGVPITTAGTIALDWASQAANLILASPDGGPGLPSFRALVAGDIPDLSGLYVPVGADPLPIYTKLAGRAGTANDTTLSTSIDGTIYGSTQNTRGLILRANSGTNAGSVHVNAGGGFSVTSDAGVSIQGSTASVGGTLVLAEPFTSGVNTTTFTTQAQAGDILYTLPAADAAGALTSDGAGNLSWASAGVATHDLLSASHPDVVASAVSRGSLIVGNATPKWAELAIGAADTFLGSDGTDAAWAAVAYSQLTGVPSTFPATPHALMGPQHSDVADETPGGPDQGSLLTFDAIITGKWQQLFPPGNDTALLFYDASVSNIPIWLDTWTGLTTGGGDKIPVGDVYADSVGGSLGKLILGPTSVTAGSYTSANITVDSKGRITAASNGGSGVSTHVLLDSSVHTDSVSQTVSRGSLIYGNATPKWDELTIGAADRFLGSDGTDAAWTAPAALTKTDDTNVTLSLGGTPATALLRAASLTLGWTGTLAIARGGTGQATALAAFNALSPLTTRGDLLTRDATNNVRLAVGASARLLQSDGTDPSWVAVSGDATIAAGGAVTLASTAVTPGSYGDASNVGSFTVDAKGRITAASNVPISGAAGGTVTSVAGGVGLTGTPEPIVGAGTLDLDINSLTTGTIFDTSDYIVSLDTSVGSGPSATRKMTWSTILTNLASFFQPLDADLTAIAALTGTGIASRTATDTWALTSGTVNQLLYWDTGGLIPASEAALTYDPSSNLHTLIHSGGESRSTMTGQASDIFVFSNTAIVAGGVTTRRARGTNASRLNVQNGDALGVLGIYGLDDQGVSNWFPGFKVTATAAEDWVVGVNGTRTVMISPQIGVSGGATQERLAFEGDGSTAIFGSLYLKNNAISSTVAELRFYEPSAGANFTAIKAQAQTADITYTLPAAVAAANDAILVSTTGGSLSWMTQATLNAALDHGTLAGLADDDHAGYALLAGRTGSTNDLTLSTSASGNLYGSSSSFVDLRLNSTSNVTKGDIVAIDRLRVVASTQQALIYDPSITIASAIIKEPIKVAGTFTLNSGQAHIQRSFFTANAFTVNATPSGLSGILGVELTDQMTAGANSVTMQGYTGFQNESLVTAAAKTGVVIGSVQTLTDFSAVRATTGDLTVTDWRGVDIAGSMSGGASGSVTATTRTAYRVSNPTTDGTVAIGTHVGLDIADFTLGTTKRSILSRGSAVPMLHAGKVRFGDLTAPSDMIEAAGAIYAQDAASATVTTNLVGFGVRKDFTMTGASGRVNPLEVSGTWTWSIDVGADGNPRGLYSHQKITGDGAGTLDILGSYRSVSHEVTYEAAVASQIVLADVAVAHIPTFQRTSSNGFTLTGTTAVQSSPIVSTGATVAARVGFDHQVFSGAGTVTSDIALKVGALTSATSIAVDVGAISTTTTLGCALRSAITASAGKRYCIRDTGGADSIFKGQVRFGDTTDPTAMVDFIGKTTFDTTGKVTRYNNIASAGMGVPPIYVEGVSATKTGNFTVFSYTPPSTAGRYRVSAVITTTSSTNTGTVQTTLDYVDSQGTTHTADIIPLCDAAGSIATTKSGASKEFHSLVWEFSINNAGTAIALKVVITGTVSYTVCGTLEQLG